MRTLLELAIASVAATLVIGLMVSVALAIYRRRIPADGWDLEVTQKTPEQRYREARHG